MIHMEYYLIVSAIMFFAGIYGFFTRKGTLTMLISIELILNATDINFAVFNRYLFSGSMEGYFFTLFSIAISAAETAVQPHNNIKIPKITFFILLLSKKLQCKITHKFSQTILLT